MKKNTFLLLMLLLSWTAEFAHCQKLTQKTQSNVISISAGNSILARQDLIYSPFVHAGHSFQSYGMNYRREKNFYQYWNLRFSANTSQIGVPFEMDMYDHSHSIYPHEFLIISTAYGIGKPIGSSLRFRNWVGVSIKTELQAAFYNFALSDMFGYYIENSANGWFRTASILNGTHHLSAHFELPVLSWLARPPYLAEDDKFIDNISSHNRTKILLAFVGDGKPVTWNTLQRANIDIEYLYPVSKRLFLGVDYRFVFIHSSEPRTLLSYHHNLHITSAFKF